MVRLAGQEQGLGLEAQVPESVPRCSPVGQAVVLLSPKVHQYPLKSAQRKAGIAIGGTQSINA